MNRKGFENVYQQRAERRIPTYDPIEGPFDNPNPIPSATWGDFGVVLGCVVAFFIAKFFGVVP